MVEVKGKGQVLVIEGTGQVVEVEGRGQVVEVKERVQENIEHDRLYIYIRENLRDSAR